MNTGNVKKTYLGGMLTLFMLFSMIILCCLTDNSVYAMTGVSSGDLYADKSSVTMNVAEHSYITVIDTSNRFNGSNGELAVSSTNSSIVYIKSKDFSNSSYSVDLKQSYNNMYLIKIQALAEGEASIRIRNSYGNMLTVPVKVDKMKRTAVFGDSETLKFTYKDEMWSPSPNMLTFDIGGMISYEVDYTDEALMAKLSPDTFDLHINDIEFSAPDGLSFSEDSSAKTYYIVPQSDIVVNLNDKFTVSVPVFAESDYAAEKYASTAAITVTAHTDAGTFSHSYGVNIFDDRKRGNVNPDPDAYSGKCIVVTASSINSTKDLVVSEGEDVVVKGDVSCNNLYVNGGTLTICSKSTLNVIGNAVVSGGSTNWLNPISTDKCGGVLEVNGKLKVGNDLTVSEPCGILNMRNSGCSVTVMNNFLITTNSTTYTCTLTEGTLSVGGKFEASGKYSGNFKASQNHLTVLSGNSFDVVMDKSDSHFNHLALSDEAYSSFTSGTEKELYSANIKGRFYKLSDKNSDLTKYLSDNNPVLRQLDETYNNYMGKSDFKDNMSSLKKYVSSEFFDKIVADTMFFCDMENMAIATNSSESGLNFAQWFTDISFVAYFNNGNTVLEMNAPNEPTVYVCVAWLGQSIGSKKSTVSASLFNVRYIVDCGNDKYITGDRVCTLSFKDLDNLGNSLVEIYKDTTNTNGTIDDYLTWFKKYVLASYSDLNTIFNAATGTNGKLDLTDINVLTNLTQKTYKAVKNKNLGSFAIKSPADVSKLPKKITTFLSSDKSAWDIATLISCPVNVVVKDSTGAIVAYVFDNKVKVTSDEADISVINGDQKYIRFSSIDDYTLELTGTDSGTMSYYVYECDSDEINRSFCADNIPLTDGIKYTGKVDSITDCSADDFSLTDDDGEKYKPSSDGGSSEPDTDYTEFNYSISNGEVTINGYKGTDTAIKIPSKIEGYPVTVIRWYAFFCQKSLTSIIIPDSVTAIEYHAFRGCTDLTSITILGDDISIGDNAFSDCTNLETISIPKNAKFDSYGETFDNCASLKNVIFSRGIEKIPDYLFYKSSNLNSLTSITIPDSVTTIGRSSFSGCTGLTSITIPDNVTTIGRSSFSGCTGLTSVTIPDGVTSIGEYTFSGCTGLTSVTIPDSVTTIGGSAFSGCKGLTSVTIPDSVTTIGSSSFSGCIGLTSITIPDSVTSIGSSAFSGCTNLETVTIPKNAKFDSKYGGTFNNCTSLKNVIFSSGIPDYLFYKSSNLNSLTSITIPDSVTSVGMYAFNGCTNLETITIPKNAQFSSNGYTFDDCTSLKNVIFSSGIEKIPDYLFYKSSNLNSLPSNVIPNSVTTIGNSAFGYCTSLTSITIPDSVTSIGSGAFSGCTGLTSITIPDSVTSIGSSAFSSCTGLTSVTIPDSVTSIGYSTFSGCTGLTSIIIPDSVTSIGGSAFSGCTGLTSIAIPDSVTTIGLSAFSDCTGLTSIAIPDSVTTIGIYAFFRCTGLINITIPDSVTTIGGSAFSGCTGLTSITIPKNAKIDFNGGGTFDNCTSLKNVIFSSGIEKIPDYLFYRSSSLNSLTSITIPNSVTTIGSGAFSSCTGLTNINIPDSVTFIGSSAFSGCTGLTSVTIPDSVTTIGNYAFDGCTNLTIYCYPNSYAETYAKSNNIPYKYLEEKPKTSITPVISVSTVQVSENAADSDVIAAIRAAAAVSFGNTNVDPSDYELVITAVSGKKDTYTVSVKLTQSGSGKYTLTSDGAKEITVTRKSSEEASKPVITAANAYDCSVDLEWTAVSGAEKYAVYYTVGGKWYNAGTTTELSMTVTGLTGAIKYGFAVKAYVNNAWTGIASADIVYAIPTSMMDKAGITSIQLIANGTLRIGWSPISGAEKYAFYYIVDGKWHTVGTTTERNIVVTNLKDNVKYGFAIKGCINGLWTEIRNSDIVYYTPDFSKPYIIKAEPQDGKVALNWISVDGATQYAVYYTVGGKWYNAGTTTALGKYVTGLTGGTKYGFAVKAYVNGTWTGITSSNIVYATPTGEAAKPKITKAQGQDGKVALNWTAVDGATNYAVYTYLNGKWSVAGYRTATGMYVTGLTNGTRYGFAVKAYVNGAWTGITSSDIVYATPVGSAAVKPIITKAQGQDGRVALNWTAVDGATNYAVYTYLNGKWSVAGYRTATGMYVTGLTNGTRYGFAVKAYVNGAWTSITSSDIVYAAPTAAKSEIMFDEFLDFIDVAPVSR